MTIAKMNAAVDQLAKSNIGYDQWARWSFFKNGKIVPNTAADCSSICGAIAKLGGYDVDLTGTFYTGNFAAKLKAAGFTVLKYTGLSQVKAGDFILSPGHHVEYAYTATRWYSARIDERGKAYGGKPGNQSGKETGFINAYTYSKGWDYVVRPPEQKTKTPSTKPVGREETLRFQERANFYMKAGLVEDGVNGSVTKAWRKWVGEAQRALNGFKSGNTPKLLVDEDPGPITANYVGVVQRRNGLVYDEWLGPVMVRWMRSHGSPIKDRPANRPK